MARFASSFPEHQVYEDQVDLYTFAATEDANGIGTVVAQIPADVRAALVYADVQTASNDVLDLFDLFVQTRIPQGVGTDLWIDVVHFTQFTGLVVPIQIQEFAKVCSAIDEAHFDVVADPLAANSVRQVLGDAWRVRWEIFDGGGSHQFGFNVRLQPI